MRYFIITYYTKPDGRIDEETQVSNHIRSRDLQCANIILDFKQQRVEKAWMNGQSMPRDWERIVLYYMRHYESTFQRLARENGYEFELFDANSPTPTDKSPDLVESHSQ
jgi:hypothetical protein